jgi:hypothetical protein
MWIVIHSDARLLALSRLKSVPGWSSSFGFGGQPSKVRASSVLAAAKVNSTPHRSARTTAHVIARRLVMWGESTRLLGISEVIVAEPPED